MRKAIPTIIHHQYLIIYLQNSKKKNHLEFISKLESVDFTRRVPNVKSVSTTLMM